MSSMAIDPTICPGCRTSLWVESSSVPEGVAAGCCDVCGHTFVLPWLDRDDVDVAATPIVRAFVSLIELLESRISA